MYVLVLAMIVMIGGVRWPVATATATTAAVVLAVEMRSAQCHSQWQWGLTRIHSHQ